MKMIVIESEADEVDGSRHMQKLELNRQRADARNRTACLLLEEGRSERPGSTFYVEDDLSQEVLAACPLPDYDNDSILDNMPNVVWLDYYLDHVDVHLFEEAHRRVSVPLTPGAFPANTLALIGHIRRHLTGAG